MGSCRLLQKTLNENEELREIFRFASLEFEKKNREIVLLNEKLNKANITIKRLLEENESLSKGLQEVEARNNLLNKMVFGTNNSNLSPPIA